MMQSNQQQNHDLSFCIVWSPLPPITWILPFIGHVGIADSNGIASDFRGPYFVGDDGRLAFGAATRALKLDIGNLDGGVQSWDDAIQNANQIYRGRMHNICCDNCHSHVACALNQMKFRAYCISKWNMVNICFLIFFRARFLSWWGIIQQFGPFAALVTCWILLATK